MSFLNRAATQERRPKWARIAIPGLVAVIAVGACSSDSDTKKSKGSVESPSEESTTTTTAPSTTTTMAPSATTTTAAPTTTTSAKPTTTTTQPPTTTTTEAPASSEPSFANCTEAKAAGYKDILRGQPGYADHLDRDQDGVACES